jgi:hypothetical protein
MRPRLPSLPVLECHLGDGRVFLDTRIGYQDIDAAERLDGFVEQARDVVFVPDIGLDRDGAAPGTRDLRDDFFGLVAAAVVIDHDLGAGLGEREADAAANAGIATGNEHHLVLQADFHGILQKVGAHGCVRRI